MRRLAALFIVAAALAMNACEKHPASELPAKYRDGAKAENAEGAPAAKH